MWRHVEKFQNFEKNPKKDKVRLFGPVRLPDIERFDTSEL
jgi:hypothetical protein